MTAETVFLGGRLHERRALEVDRRGPWMLRWRALLEDEVKSLRVEVHRLQTQNDLLRWQLEQAYRESLP